jgi:hypothetical protein
VTVIVNRLLPCVLFALIAPVVAADAPRAIEAPPMTAAEAKAFIRVLTQYVHDHHLKRDETTEQRGMVYEYYDTATHELAGGLRTWEAIFKEKGYVPTGIGAGTE